MIPADTKVIPGHGPIGDRDSLNKFADMLEGTLAAVKRGLDAGKTLPQLKEEKVLAEWDSWAKGYFNADQFIEMLVADLTKK